MDAQWLSQPYWARHWKSGRWGLAVGVHGEPGEPGGEWLYMYFPDTNEHTWRRAGAFLPSDMPPVTTPGWAAPGYLPTLEDAAEQAPTALEQKP